MPKTFWSFLKALFRRKQPIERYYSYVLKLAESESKDLILNGSPEHASCLFAAMLQNAKEHVRILCKNLSKEVFDQKRVLDALNEAIELKIHITIITQEEPQDGDFLKKIREYQKKTLIKNISTDHKFQHLPKLLLTGANFCTMDERAYRYESENILVNAVACFNDVDSTKLYNELIDNIKATAAKS